MKALKGKNAEKVLNDQLGKKQLKEFLNSTKEESIIQLSTGEKFKVSSNNMNAEKPAMGVAKIQDFGDRVCYRIECDCYSHDHAVDTIIEVERIFDDMPDISVRFYMTMYNKFPRSFWDRVKQAASILFTGANKQEHEIILKPQAAKNWIQAVENSIKEFEEKHERKTD
jgi:hypothetical protein